MTHDTERRRARIVMGALATGLGFFSVMPAHPAGAETASPRLKWRSERASDGGLSGTVHLRAKVRTGEPVEGWSLTVATPAGEPVFGVVCDEQFNRPRDHFDVDCRWDTRRYPDERPSANGRYVVRLTTTRDGADTPAGPDRDVAVDNPPSSPEGVTLTYDDASRRATLTWTANPEPDVTRYDVEEKVDDDEWARVAETTATRLDRVLTKAGRHRFRVAAERRTPDGASSGPGPWAAAPSSSSPNVKKEPDRQGERPGRPTRTAAHSEAPPSDTPPARHAESAPPGPATTVRNEPPPEERPSLQFSTASGNALASLSTPSPATVGPRPARAALPTPIRFPGPAGRGATSTTAETDPGYQETLPYPRPDAGRDEDGESQLTAGPGPAAASGRAAAPGPGTRRRLGAISLVTGSAGLLGTALHAARRKRHGTEPITGQPPAGRALITEPPPTGPDPAPLRLEACIARLEAGIAAAEAQLRG